MDGSLVNPPARWFGIDVFQNPTNAASGSLRVSAGQKLWLGVRRTPASTSQYDPILDGSGGADAYAPGHSAASAGCGVVRPPDFALIAEVIPDPDASLTLV